MPDLTIQITLPDDLDPEEQQRVLKLKIATDRNGRRLMTRQLKDANSSTPGRIKRVPYVIGGLGIGSSSETYSGGLTVDWTRNLELRWDGRLLSGPLQESVVLTGDDPPAATSGFFGGFTFGTNLFGVVTPPFGPSISGEPVVVFDEQAGRLFAERGQLSTEVDMSTTPWTLVETSVLPARARDSAWWRGNVYIAVGPSAPMQRRVGVGVLSILYEDTVATNPAGPVYANAVKVGSDRAWYIVAEPGAEQNYAGFTLDRFVTLAAPFQVGDPDRGTTGIGPFGAFTMFGSESGLYSFTDQGKPIPLSRALLAILSPMNGIQWADPGWNWNYTITTIGLRAVSDSGVDNPVGIGESMRGFTGHNGVPVAIFAARGELWAVYQDATGDLYGYRGQFGPRTAGTGQPIWFPWFYEADGTCGAIFSTVTPNRDTQDMTIIRAQGTNLTHMLIARNGLDDLATTYPYSPDGGTAWMTTIDRDPQLLKTFRVARIRTRNTKYGNSWAVSCAFDARPQDPVNALYIPIGTVTTDGFHTLAPLGGTPDEYGNLAPSADISGRTLKVRLDQVADGVVTNYAANPSAEDGVSLWSFGTSGGGRTTAQHLYGDYSFVIARVGAFTAAAQLPITLPPNTTYVASIGVYVPTGNITALTPSISGLAGATGDLSSAADMSLRDQWQTVAIGPFTTGSDVTGVFNCTPVSSGNCILYFDGAMVANADEQIPYFDGSFGAGYAWTGTPQLSTSTWTAGVTDPPEVNALEVEYEERPEQYEEIAAVVELESLGSGQDNELWSKLRKLSGSSTRGPFRVHLPDDMPPGVSGGSGGGQVWAMLGPVTKREDVTGETEGVNVVFSTWPQAEALSSS